MIVSAAVGVFDAMIAVFSDFSNKFLGRFPSWCKALFVFLLSGALGFLFPNAIYSGHDIIDEMIHLDASVWLLLITLAFRVVMMLFVTDSGATGGIFIPTLAIGALVSALAVRALIPLGLSKELFSAAVMLGMCAFL